MDRYTKHTNYNYTKNTTKTTDNLKKHRNQEEQKELKTNETSLFHTNSSKQTQYSSNTLETSDAESHYTSPIKRYGSWCSVAYNGADDKPIVYYSSNYKKSLLSPTKGVEPKQGGYKTMRYVSAETVGLTPNLRIEKELEALSKLETICLTKRLQCKELTNMVEELNHRKYSITLSGEFDEVLPKLINFIIKNDTLINQNFIDKLFSKENYEGYNATSDSDEDESEYEKIFADDGKITKANYEEKLTLIRKIIENDIKKTDTVTELDSHILDQIMSGEFKCIIPQFQVTDQLYISKNLGETDLSNNAEYSFNIVDWGPLIKELETLWALGIIHRDIKPENLFFYKGKVVLSDLDTMCKVGESIKNNKGVGTLEFGGDLITEPDIHKDNIDKLCLLRTMLRLHFKMELDKCHTNMAKMNYLYNPVNIKQFLLSIFKLDLEDSKDKVTIEQLVTFIQTGYVAKNPEKHVYNDIPDFSALLKI